MGRPHGVRAVLILKWLMEESTLDCVICILKRFFRSVYTSMKINSVTKIFTELYSHINMDLVLALMRREIYICYSLLDALFSLLRALAI